MNKEKTNRTISNPRGLSRLLPRFTVESPFFILVVLIAVIFIAEGVIMYLLNRLPYLSPFVEGILDAGILIVLVFPFLYIFVFRPLIRQLQMRRAAEKELLLSKESFNSIVRKSAYGILVVDPKGIVQFMNPIVEVMLNCKAEDCIGRPFKYEVELGTVRNVSILIGEQEKGIAELRTVETEWRGKSAYLIDLLDITERIRAEEDLQEHEDQFRSLTLSAIDAILGLDREGRISIWNKAASSMFGYSEKEVLGKDLHSLLVPERYREKAYQGLKRFIKTGAGPVIGKTLELFGLRKDGNEFPIELSVSAWRTGDTWHATGVIRDITKRKQAEEILKRSESKYKTLSKQLTEANNMKELLLDIITHDLKNPASVINGFAGLLLEQDSADQMTQSIMKSSDTLLKVIDSATALAGVATGESIEKQEINLSQMLQDVKLEFEQMAKHAKIEIKFHPLGDIYINANPILSEVFKNYLSNTIKYAKDGKQIILEIKKENESIQVYVKDFGETIAEENKEAIFLRQARLDNEIRGRGLGLAIVKRIAEAHGGEVWVGPNEPTGNIFYLKIPRYAKT